MYETILAKHVSRFVHTRVGSDPRVILKPKCEASALRSQPVLAKFVAVLMLYAIQHSRLRDATYATLCAMIAVTRLSVRRS